MQETVFVVVHIRETTTVRAHALLRLQAYEVELDTFGPVYV
jgi:hypothetical protein